MLSRSDLWRRNRCLCAWGGGRRHTNHLGRRIGALILSNSAAILLRFLKMAASGDCFGGCCDDSRVAPLTNCDLCDYGLKLYVPPPEHRALIEGRNMLALDLLNGSAEGRRSNVGSPELRRRHAPHNPVPMPERHAH